MRKRDRKEELAAFFGLLDPQEDQEPKSAGKQYQEKRFSDEDGYLYWLNASPIRMYPGYSLPDTLTPTETGRCLECAYLLEKGTNMLCHKVNGHYKALSAKMLAKRLEITDRQCYRFIRKMINTRVMVREGRALYMNPRYFFRGKYLSYSLYSMFKQDMDEVLPAWVVEKYRSIGEQEE